MIGTQARFNITENVEINHFRLNEKGLALAEQLGGMGSVPKTAEYGTAEAPIKASNLFTTAGKASAVNRIGGITEDAFTYMAIGTGTTAAAAGDTALETEITTGGGARAAATVSAVTTTTTGDTLQLVHSFTFTSTFAVTELGIFNAASGGDMLSHLVMAAVNVSNGSVVEFTWKGDLS